MIDEAQGIGASSGEIRRDLGEWGSRNGCVNTRPGYVPARLPRPGRSQAAMAQHNHGCPLLPSNQAARRWMP